jgi:IS5 family transposase
MQTSFSELERAAKKKVKRRDRFQPQVDAVAPLAALLSALVLYYPKSDKRRGPPICLERLLRIYVEKCFCLSDEDMEDAVYDSQAIRCFIGIDLNR